MNELRKDYFMERYVIIASKRGKRPHEFVQKPELQKPEVDYFAPGNEHLTPPTLDEVKEGNTWKMRAFLNKFPAVEEYESAAFQNSNDMISSSPAFGHHEVLVETNTDQQLWDLSKVHIHHYLIFLKKRFNAIKKKQNIAYISVFKNQGNDAGTSIFHSHTQMVGYTIIPSLITQKVIARQKANAEPYGRIIETERNSKRFIMENESFFVLAPFASRYNFEAWIIPKLDWKTISDIPDDRLLHLAEGFVKLLVKLKELNASYNYHFHYAPEGEFRLHIEFTPRLSKFGGFEIGTDTVINIMPPEEAAAFYRGEE